MLKYVIEEKKLVEKDATYLNENTLLHFEILHRNSLSRKEAPSGHLSQEQRGKSCLRIKWSKISKQNLNRANKKEKT